MPIASHLSQTTCSTSKCNFSTFLQASEEKPLSKSQQKNKKRKEAAAKAKAAAAGGAGEQVGGLTEMTSAYHFREFGTPLPVVCVLD